MKKLIIIGSLLIGCLLSTRVVAMCGMPECTHGTESDKHEEKSEKKTVEKKIEVKESFYSTVYVCPMHPEVQQDKSGKCPKCDMKLEKKQVLMTYACPEKDCEYQKAKPGQCPEHKKDLVKCEIKHHCPKCGEQVDPEELKLKPVKP